MVLDGNESGTIRILRRQPFKTPFAGTPFLLTESPSANWLHVSPVDIPSFRVNISSSFASYILVLVVATR